MPASGYEEVEAVGNGDPSWWCIFDSSRFLTRKVMKSIVIPYLTYSYELQLCGGDGRGNAENFSSSSFLTVGQRR